MARRRPDRRPDRQKPERTQEVRHDRPTYARDGADIRLSDRVQSEHPVDEALSVIMRGRVLGGLEPTRAFGDARYKWSREVQAV